MGCSHCGLDDHNIRTCKRVRRCGCCNSHGHDRRNCPELRPADDRPTSACSPERLGYLCRGRDDLLAHLYWPGKVHYFETNLAAYRKGGGWLFVATPGHGVHTPSRPTINFFAVDRMFADLYQEVAEARGLKHGMLIERAAIETAAATDGFEVADVKIGYPHGHGETDPAEFWRFDLGNHRFKSVAALQFATVVRLATPTRQRRVRIDPGAVVAWW